jgi:Ca2+-binding EF-hand superfamily protein
MYDIDGNGLITREEMSQIMDSFYKLVGPLVTFSGKKYESSQQLVDEFFEQADSDGDGKVSLADYRDAAVKNPDIIQGLRLFA